MRTDQENQARTVCHLAPRNGALTTELSQILGPPESKRIH